MTGPWRAANNGTGARIWFLYRDDVPADQRYRYGKSGRHIRYGSCENAQRVANRLNAEIALKAMGLI